MAKKRKLFNIKNVLTTLKAVVAGFLVMLIGIIPTALVWWLRTSISTPLFVVSWIVALLWLVFSLFLWGYFVNRWWKWE